eukprot:scaffold6778_cov129-Isochrysis_galbana.AAC.7
MQSDSPNSPNPLSPPPPSSPCTRGSYRLERRRDGLRALLKSFLSIGWVKRGESTLTSCSLLVRVGSTASLSKLPTSRLSRGKKREGRGGVYGVDLLLIIKEMDELIGYRVVRLRVCAFVRTSPRPLSIHTH